MLVYATACGQTAEQLMDMVNEYLADGYKPQGGPVVVGSGSREALVQAIVKEIPDSPDSQNKE
jgi:hypothetical protein